jgi:polyhydroxyalkanoate synthase
VISNGRRLRTRNGLKHVAGVRVPEVGCSPKDVVWSRDKARLYRYHSDRRTLSPPLLLVMSLVSKPYVLDLRPGNSFIEALVAAGFDVYALDWGVPTPPTRRTRSRPTATVPAARLDSRHA